MFGLEVLFGIAVAHQQATERCADYGVDPTPGNVAFVAAVYNSPQHADGRPVDRDAWAGRNHAETVKRSRKGATSKIIRARGRAFVIGAHDIPVLLDVCGRHDHDGKRLGMLRGGWSTLAVQRATDQLYRGQIPDMLGTDVESWAEVIHADRSATDVHGVAVHRSDVAGYLNVTSATRGVLVTDRRTSGGKVSWPTRLSIRKPAKRASDPVPAVRATAIDGAHLAAIPTDTPDWHAVRVLPVIAGHVDRDRMWIGHRLVNRDAAKHARTATAARTVGAFRADSLAMALDAMGTTSLAAGERATFTADDWTLTITRGKSDRKAWSARARRGDDPAIAVKGAATSSAVATRLRNATATA